MKLPPDFPQNRPAVLLAPMAGYTDLAFRILCAGFGADAVYSEMVSARSLVEGNLKGFSLLRTAPKDRPLFVQLFGYDPEVCGRAAAMVQERVRPAGMDLNFGCPVRKVARGGSGAVMMQEPEKIEALLRNLEQDREKRRKTAADGVVDTSLIGIG